MIGSHAVCRQALALSLAAGCSLLVSPPQTQAAPSSAAPTAHRNLPDSFLPLAAESVGAVVRQIRSQPIVRRRYARYFHVPETQVASYLQTNLVQSRLAQGGVYTVYLVRPNGLIYPAMLTLPKGSLVFALRGGSTVMTRLDGNPVVRYRMAVENRLVPSRAQNVMVKVAPSVQTLIPTRVQTTIVTIPVATPVYQPPPLDSGDVSTTAKP